MKCPLFSIAEEHADGVWRREGFDCLQDDCAWWDKTRDQCCIKSACNGVMGIMSDTMAIREHMPHEGQFRK
jgi:hypothetical protein